MSSESAWKVSGYIAESMLGYGATGQVWRGRTVRSGHPVALKRIDCRDPARRRAAQSEAALLSALEHPHLVRLHELLPDGDALVLVLDLAEGGSLADILRRRAVLAVGEVVTALSPVAAALAYAHNEGVTHGDVSAANVLFTSDGVPLLADMGTARLLGDTGPADATLEYLDPAVAAGGAPGPPSDVFSLAALALHALCGSPPWSGRSAEEITSRAASGEIVDLDLRLAAVPAAVARVVRRGLSIAPHARGTAADFALDLRQAAQPVPVELAAGRGPVRPAATGGLGATATSLPADTASLTLTPEWEWRLDRPGFAGPATVANESARHRRGSSTASAIATPDDPPDWSALPITHAVRARVRPELPPLGRRAQFTGAVRSRMTRRPVLGGPVLGGPALGGPALGGPAARRRAAGVTLIVVSLSIAATLWWATRNSSDPRSRIPAAASPTARAAPSGSAPMGMGWAAVLARLDAQREKAFATANAGLLAEVYVEGPLLRQDTSSLTRSVPAGCEVKGLRTSYAGVVLISRTAATVTVRATATLAKAAVTCGNTVSSFTAARAATQLTIGLASVGGDYRIESLRIG